MNTAHLHRVRQSRRYIPALLSQAQLRLLMLACGSDLHFDNPETEKWYGGGCGIFHEDGEDFVVLASLPSQPLHPAYETVERCQL